MSAKRGSRLSDELLQHIDEVSKRYGVNPNLVYGIISVESTFDPRARSAKGAKGLMQLMPATAMAMGVSDPYDPKQSIEGGTKYLSQLLDQYKGNLRKALGHYIGGELGGASPKLYSRYINRVMRRSAIAPFPWFPSETRFDRD